MERFDELEDDDVTGWLRRYVIGRLHVGALGPGAPLPSIRRIAKESGVDHRRVAEAYRALAAEGLVEIREAAGVFVSTRAGADTVREERNRWMAELLYSAWGRHIAPSSLRDVVAAATSRTLRCAVVDETLDHRFALRAELETDFELEVVELEPEPAGVDFVVGTLFEAPAVHAAAARLGVPALITAVDPELTRGVVRRLEAGPVVAVISDPRFAERARDYLIPSPFARLVSFVLSESVQRLEDVEVPSGATLLATRAARRDLGAVQFHLIPFARFIAPASARALFRLMLQLRGVER